MAEEHAAPGGNCLPLPGQRRIEGDRVGRWGVDPHELDGEEDDADGHQEVGSNLHGVAGQERQRSHCECRDAEHDHERLVGDPVRQGQREE